MSILTGRIAYQLDPPKDWGHGLTYKIKVKPDAGGEFITLFVKADSQDASKLGKDVTVFYKLIEGKPRFEGVQSAPTDNQAQPQAPKPGGVDFDTIVRTWKECYSLVKQEIPVLQDEPAFMAAVNSIFIQAAREGAWVRENPEV